MKTNLVHEFKAHALILKKHQDHSWVENIKFNASLLKCQLHFIDFIGQSL